MAGTWRLFCNTSHHCQGQGEGSFFWGERGPFWSSGRGSGWVLSIGGRVLCDSCMTIISIGQILISRLFPISYSYLNL